jgi:hypothetical protein
MRIASVFAIAIALLSPVLLFAVNPGAHADATAKTENYLIVYNVSDLPVWRNKGKSAPEFAPDVLVKYLRATVEPKSWAAGAEIRPIVKDASLVICQTQANHEKVSAAIKSFRANDARETDEHVSATPPVDVGDFGNETRF